MAPTVPKSKRDRFGPGIRSSRPYPTTGSASTFTVSKRDKRAIKSSVFRSKIEKASTKKASKTRRRPSKKLVTTLESLADALPDIAPSPVNKKSVTAGTHDGLSSLKSQRGIRKVKERVDKEERTRFANNMAVMAQGDPEGSTTNNRWAALRQHINNSIGVKEDVEVG